MALPEIPTQADPPAEKTSERTAPRREETLALHALAAGLVAAATSWYLLKELGPLLRPLVLAGFLAYLVVPIHHWLRRHTSATVSGFVIVGGTLVLLWWLTMIIYIGIIELNAELPRLIDRARGIMAEARAFGRTHLPPGLVKESTELTAVESQGWDTVRATMRILAAGGAAFLTEALVVGVYLVFLMLDLRRFPNRIRAGFGAERAGPILDVVARINGATVRYLRAKTVASLATGIPSAIVLWAFGVEHPAMWGVLIFFGNFVPYVGSLVALTPPILLAFLDLHPAWKPCAVTLLLIAIQAVTGSVVETLLASKAVDLSPVVTVFCLAFWSLCWGLTGLILAVPLTAMLKIIWENVAYTRPLAALMAETVE
jgi:AI-2 transport protein TqsA